jgi:DNA polymerase-4
VELPLNHAPAEIMHVDLNACFAMTEQQANPLLRGRPIGVVNRLGSRATIIAPSYEAKQLGIRCGTTVDEAQKLAPGIIILETDPAKYRYVHGVIKQLFESYAPRVTMRSIDEGVLDFRGTTLLRQDRSLIDIGQELKRRVAEELGDWMTINVGLGPNWFLAKLAAGLNKPDGLDLIDHTNLEGVYLATSLLDLNGINHRFARRLAVQGITTPIEFLNASEQTLWKQVFGSVNGRHWYLRLRGYEVDQFEFGVHHVGKQYVLHHPTDDPEELDRILYKLCYYISRRLRKYNLASRGLWLSVRYQGDAYRSGGFGHFGTSERHLWQAPVHSAHDLHDRSKYLLGLLPSRQVVVGFSLTSYQLEPRHHEQLALYDTQLQRDNRVEVALQAVNDRYGELSLIPARLLGTQDYVPEKIAFGSARYLLKDDPA